MDEVIDTTVIGKSDSGVYDTDQLPTSIEDTNSNKFHVELNYGLALPFKFYVDKSYDLTQEHRAQVTSVDQAGSVKRLEIITQSDLGPLGALENDILLVLLSMAKEQRDEPYNKDAKDGYKVYFTYSEIAKRLGLVPKNWTTKVRNAINVIKSQGIKAKNFSYNAKDGQIVMVSPEDATPLIKTGTIKIGNTKSDFSSYSQVFYAIFDTFVFDNLYGQYRSVIQSNDYLKLKVGPQRRIFIFLTSKKEQFGSDFGFDLSELAAVLGLTASGKKRRQIGEYLKKIKETLGSIDFTIKKKGVEDDWDIWINFLALDMLEAPKLDPFYAALLDFYKEEFLFKHDLREIDIFNLRGELLSFYKKLAKSDVFTFQKKEYHPVDFAIDIALFQGKFCNYPITSLKGLIKKILESMAENFLELPDKFRYFVSHRLEEAKKEESELKMKLDKQRREQIESEKKQLLEKSFNDVYNSLEKSNPTYMNQLRNKAQIKLKEDEKLEGAFPEMMKEIFIAENMRKIAQEEWNSGTFLDQDFNEVKSLPSNIDAKLLS